MADRGKASRAIWPGLREAAGALLGVVFPAECRVCGGVYAEATRLPVCSLCLESFLPLKDPLCEICGRPVPAVLAASPVAPRCQLCRRGVYSFDRARSFAAYDPAMTSAILLLKYEAVRPLANWFSARLAEVFASNAKEFPVDIVVPVPLHPARLRERGFNQAELLARPLARRLGLEMRSELLVRTKPRPDKLRLSRQERWRTVRGAYEAREGARIDNLRVLLVDDVLTTGATLDACSRALRHGGAKGVFCLTVARVVDRWADFPSAGDQQTRETGSPGGSG